MIPSYPPGWSQTLRTKQDVDNAIQEQKKQLSEIRDRIRMLNARRNALVPIGRLPPEVLGEIFLILVKERFYRLHERMNLPDYYYYTTSKRCCFEFLGVCHHWREVALRTPRLWSYILLHNRSKLDMVGTCLERSRNAPLTITWLARCSFPQGDGWQEDIARNMYRIRYLTAELRPSFFKSVSVSGLACRANDPVHGTLVPVIGPALHQVTDVADVRALDWYHGMPGACRLVQDFETTNCVLEEQGQRAKVCVSPYSPCSPCCVWGRWRIVVSTTKADT